MPVSDRYSLDRHDKKLAGGDRVSITQSAVVLEKLIGQFLFSKAQEDPAPAKK